MKNIVLFSFLFFSIFSNEALAETESKVIIDVRTESEWVGGHLQGASHIPLSEIKNKIKFFHKSLDSKFYQKFDLIVSNPPYIKKSEIKNLKEDVRKFEPRIALDGGNDGLDLIKKVIYKSKYILKIKGMLALEIGNEQFNKVSKILKKNNFKIEHIIKEYKDNIRGIISTQIGN